MLPIIEIKRNYRIVLICEYIYMYTLMLTFYFYNFNYIYQLYHIELLKFLSQIFIQIETHVKFFYGTFLVLHFCSQIIPASNYYINTVRIDISNKMYSNRSHFENEACQHLAIAFQLKQSIVLLDFGTIHGSFRRVHMYVWPILSEFLFAIIDPQYIIVSIQEKKILKKRFLGLLFYTGSYCEYINPRRILCHIMIKYGKVNRWVRLMPLDKRSNGEMSLPFVNGDFPKTLQICHCISRYRSDTVNSNTVHSKFHLIRTKLFTLDAYFYCLVICFRRLIQIFISFEQNLAD